MVVFYCMVGTQLVLLPQYVPRILLRNDDNSFVTQSLTHSSGFCLTVCDKLKLSKVQQHLRISRSRSECLPWVVHFSPLIAYKVCMRPVEVLTFRHRASCILGQAFRYSPENTFCIFNQQIYFII